MIKPSQKPSNPNFSSGPCSKRPGYKLENLAMAPLGRSHRAKIGKERLEDVINRTRAILEIPQDYKIAIVPASDTGAVEMAMWSLLGARGVDMLAWESFGKGWITDVVKQLKLEDVRLFEADYGHLPDLSQTSGARDIVFTWNGTTSGVKIPNTDWIPDARSGLTLCDATSAVFAMEIDWSKIDVLTYSWQKVMGGEGAHGMLVLSPRAVERLESYSPPWPLPKIFRLTKAGKLIDGIFKGATINTPSMLCVEDALDGLKWAEEIGGLSSLIARSQANFAALKNWIQGHDDFAFLAQNPEETSNTSVCLTITASWFLKLDAEHQIKAAKALATLLEEENVAYDIGSYRDAPAGLRIWCGATVEAQDVERLCPWLDWALSEIQKTI